MFNPYFNKVQYEQHRQDLARQIQDGYATQVALAEQVKKVSKYLYRLFIVDGAALMPKASGTRMQTDPS